MSVSAEEFRIISRAAFDELLAKNAEERGAARVWDSVVDAVHDGTNWTVKLRRRPPLIARVIVDATGRAARLIRRHGATLTPIDRLVVWSASCEVSDRPAIVEVDATGCGWEFSAPTVAGGRMLAFFSDRDLLTTRHGNNLPHSWPMEASRSRLWSKYAKDFGGCAVTAEAANTSYLDHAVLPGLLAIGDAAQTFDPLSSQGIRSALQDAESAAKAIAAAFDGHPEWLDRHENQRRTRFCRYLLERRAQYGAETRFDASQFWHRRKQSVGESWRPRWATA
jgi:flavin-dependent dehydrogenase